MKLTYYLPLFLLILISLSSCGRDDLEPTETEINDTKLRLAVFGDSISTGVLANTALGASPDRGFLGQIWRFLSAGEFDDEAFQKELSRPELASSTTDKGYGLRAHLAEKYASEVEEVEVISLAQFGARVDRIPNMLTELEEALLANGVEKTVSHILIMLGGNDFCADITAAEFKERITENVELIYQSYPDANYILTSIPPVYRLASIEHTYTVNIPLIGEQSVSCREMRDRFCPRLYGEDAEERLFELNEGIRAAKDFLTDKSAQLVFVESLESWEIEEKDLAFDCFHPSAAGQESIGAFFKEALEQGN